MLRLHLLNHHRCYNQNMNTSESIVNNLLREVDSISCRLTNIQQAYCNTIHVGLRERLFYENKSIILRLKQIFSIAKILKNRKESIFSLIQYLSKVMLKADLRQILLFQVCEQIHLLILFELQLLDLKKH